MAPRKPIRAGGLGEGTSTGHGVSWILEIHPMDETRGDDINEDCSKNNPETLSFDAAAFPSEVPYSVESAKFIEFKIYCLYA